jgi:hypothetical protein
MGIEESLENHWPPHRVKASCGECGFELFDTKKNDPAIHAPSYVATLIKRLAKGHENDIDHGNVNIDVEIDANPTPVEEIDATITVNEE